MAKNQDLEHTGHEDNDCRLRDYIVGECRWRMQLGRTGEWTAQAVALNVMVQLLANPELERHWDACLDVLSTDVMLEMHRWLSERRGMLDAGETPPDWLQPLPYSGPRSVEMDRRQMKIAVSDLRCRIEQHVGAEVIRSLPAPTPDVPQSHQVMWDGHVVGFIDDPDGGDGRYCIGHWRPGNLPTTLRFAEAVSASLEGFHGEHPHIRVEVGPEQRTGEVTALGEHFIAVFFPPTAETRV